MSSPDLKTPEEANADKPLNSQPARSPAIRNGWVLVSLAVLISFGVILADSYSRMAVIQETMHKTLQAPLPGVDGSTETGFEGNMRRVVLPTVGADGYQWLMHTQRLAKEGGWRIRFTDRDNTPYGREIHWSHSFIWWLMLCGWVYSAFTGLPYPASMEAVLPFANTLFLIPILLILPFLVFRRFGTLAGMLFAFGFVSVYLLYEMFMIGYPDHHGLATLTILCCSLFLVFGGAGWVRKGEPDLSSGWKPIFGPRRHAKFWFIASGVIGAAGLWISAATIVPALAGIGLGAGLSALLFGKSNSPSEKMDASLWRLWGAAGGLASLGFYLLEYFPSHMGMRLEVNHPLYALSWFCAGDLLARFVEWRSVGVSPWSTPRRIGFAILSVAGLCVLPLLIKTNPQVFFKVSDPFLWALHQDYIHEFKSLFRRLDELQPGQMLIVISALPLLALFAFRLLLLKELSPAWKAVLFLALGPALVMMALGLAQVRWIGIANGLWLVVLAVIFGVVAMVRKVHRFHLVERMAVALVLAVIFLPHPLAVGSFLADTLGKPVNIGPAAAFNLIVRDTAHTLRRMFPDKEMRVLSGPTTSTWLSFYGGFDTVGTLYWENLEGLKSAADLYATKTSNEALEKLQDRKITHIVIFSIDAFSQQYIRLARGLPENADARDAFADAVLYGSTFPDWVIPIHYVMHPQFKDEWVAILEVRPDQTPAEARLGFGRFLASRGDVQGARREYEEAVKLDPSLQEAHLELAGFLFMANDLMAARYHLAVGLKGRSKEQIAETAFTIAGHLQDAGRSKLALELLTQAFDADPKAPSVRNMIAWILATSKDPSVRNPQEALALAMQNFGFIGQSAYLNTLAAAYAASGNFEEAVRIGKTAIEVAHQNKDPDIVIDRYKLRLKSYEAGKPWRE